MLRQCRSCNVDWAYAMSNNELFSPMTAQGGARFTSQSLSTLPSTQAYLAQSQPSISLTSAPIPSSVCTVGRYLSHHLATQQQTHLDKHLQSTHERRITLLTDGTSNVYHNQAAVTYEPHSDGVRHVMGNKTSAALPLPNRRLAVLLIEAVM
jgi:hypothetical protein